MKARAAWMAWAIVCFLALTVSLFGFGLSLPVAALISAGVMAAVLLIARFG